MSYAVVTSVFIVCITALFLAAMTFQFKRSERDHRDTVQLADHLEAKIKAMDELKTQMSMLLLKNGFGR